MIEASQWQWATNSGIAVTMLFAIGWASWRVLVFLGAIVDSWNRECLPRVTKLIDGHCELMEVMKVHMGEGAKMLEKVSETQDSHGLKIAEIHRAVVPASKPIAG